MGTGVRMGGVVIAGVLLGCAGPQEGTPHTGTDHTGAGHTGVYPWPIWLYQATVAPIEAELGGPDGEAALRVDGFGWPGFGGPTLVAEPDHEIRFTVTNQTPL